MLSRVLAFLRNESNRALLGWIGGGLVVFASGFWAVFTFYVDHSKPSPPPTTTIVEQKATGIASGRDTNINAPVTINPNAKEVVAPINERLDKLAAQVAREKGVEAAPLRSVLVKLGDAGVSDEDIPKRLDAAADELIKLRAEVEQFQHGPPALAAIAREAQNLIDKGDLDGANKALVRGREAARAQRSDASRDEEKPGPPQKQIEADCGSVAIGGDVSGAKITAGSSGDCPKPRPAGPVARVEERPPVQAEEGSIAIGGNVSYSTITIGVTPENLDELVRPRTKDISDLSESQRETKALLKEKLDLTQGQVKSALEILGEANVPPERLAAKLVEIAEKFKELKTAEAAQPGDDSKITDLKGEAQKAIQDGELAKADEILAEIEKIQTEALDRLALNAAHTTAQRGDLALTRLRYPDAAQRFAEAAAKVPQGHDDERWQYLNAEATALYRQGDEFGDNAAAGSAIERYRHLAELWPRNAFPRAWAGTQMNLGTALQTLGERESGTARLEEAVAAYREALQENTRARVPLDWARTQVNLGAALETLGARESGTARLKEAAATYRDALQERTRARVPLQWATTQNNLGAALATLGDRERGTARLEEAVAAYRKALQENTRARAPLQWARTTGNQGVALMLLAERRRDAKTAKLAVQQIEAAFTTSRDGGDTPLAAIFEARLPKARALVQKLAKR